MSKRRTIGENPLDLVVSDNHLETMVPASQAFVRDRPAPAAEAPAGAQQRLEELEAAVRQLRRALGEVRIELAEVKSQMFRDSYWLAQVKEKLAGK